MLDVVCFKWRPTWSMYRSTYTADHVNTLFHMVRRHYLKPFRFSCITDDPKGLDPAIRPIRLWPDHADLASLHGVANPSCYRRLRLFAADSREIIGDRFVWLDLDMVITSSLHPLFDRREDIVLWEGTAAKNHYNAAMVMMTAGARPLVWDRFDAKESPRLAQRAGFVGSDQAWINLCLGAGEARWRLADGCYSWRLHLRFNRGKLPADARVVNFAGSSGDPWQKPVQRSAPWIVEHYRRDDDASGGPRQALGLAAGGEDD